MLTSQVIEVLKNHPLFAILSEDEITKLMDCSKRIRVRRFDFLFVPDQKSESVYLCLDGSIKVGSFNQEGKELIKAIASPGDLLGEMVLFDQERRDEYAQAAFENTLVLEMPISALRRLMQRNAEFTLAFLQYFNRRLRNTEERLAGFILKDARQRIIDFVVQIARSHGVQVGFETFVKHRYTQQDIAGITGASRQTVTKVLNDLRRDNQIKFTRKSILIRDMNMLNVEAG